MSVFEIRCEAAVVRSDVGVCPGSAKCRQGECYTLGARTPEPQGMCQRAFHSLHPVAFAMRWSDTMPWEKSEFVDVVCPDGFVTYRLSRIRNK
jgi:uncharacterized repeat protein (TIGR04076 family)